MDDSEWAELWAGVEDVQSGFEPGVVFIGGVAVFAHTRASTRYADLIAFSHDVDFMISVADYTDLKDLEQLTPNRRLRKCQFFKHGIEFDVYVEGQHDLAVPYDEAGAHSELRSGIRVACLEHLLVLKLHALDDRRGSAKGDRDAEDVLKLLLLLDERGTTPARCGRLEDRHETELGRIVRGDAAVRLTDGNLHRAATLRKMATQGVERVSECRRVAVGLGK
ncbi:MAG: hypothetical protein EXR79_02730 [Myxococcales bacterium]|nr:hypothetical protein [Myxococcales bacterium]